MAVLASAIAEAMPDQEWEEISVSADPDTGTFFITLRPLTQNEEEDHRCESRRYSTAPGREGWLRCSYWKGHGAVHTQTGTGSTWNDDTQTCAVPGADGMLRPDASRCILDVGHDGDHQTFLGSTFSTAGEFDTR
jgi:hypothetical protein